MQAAGFPCSTAAAAVLGLVLVIAGCTTFRPVAGTSDELQRRILDGELLTAGDRVRLTTADAAVHELEIDTVDFDAGTIAGRRDAVPISAVVALERRVRAPAKTWGLIGGLALLFFGTECEDDPSCDLGYGGFFCC